MSSSGITPEDGKRAKGDDAKAASEMTRLSSLPLHSSWRSQSVATTTPTTPIGCCCRPASAMPSTSAGPNTPSPLAAASSTFSTFTHSSVSFSSSLGASGAVGSLPTWRRDFSIRDSKPKEPLAWEYVAILGKRSQKAGDVEYLVGIPGGWTKPQWRAARELAFYIPKLKAMFDRDHRVGSLSVDDPEEFVPNKRIRASDDNKSETSTSSSSEKKVPLTIIGDSLFIVFEFLLPHEMGRMAHVCQWSNRLLSEHERPWMLASSRSLGGPKPDTFGGLRLGIAGARIPADLRLLPCRWRDFVKHEWPSWVRLSHAATREREREEKERERAEGTTGTAATMVVGGGAGALLAAPGGAGTATVAMGPPTGVAAVGAAAPPPAGNLAQLHPHHHHHDSDDEDDDDDELEEEERKEEKSVEVTAVYALITWAIGGRHHVPLLVWLPRVSERDIVCKGQSDTIVHQLCKWNGKVWIQSEELLGTLLSLPHVSADVNHLRLVFFQGDLTALRPLLAWAGARQDIHAWRTMVELNVWWSQSSRQLVRGPGADLPSRAHLSEKMCVLAKHQFACSDYPASLGELAGDAFAAVVFSPYNRRALTSDDVATLLLAACGCNNWSVVRLLLTRPEFSLAHVSEEKLVTQAATSGNVKLMRAMITRGLSLSHQTLIIACEGIVCQRFPPPPLFEPTRQPAFMDVVRLLLHHKTPVSPSIPTASTVTSATSSMMTSALHVAACPHPARTAQARDLIGLLVANRASIEAIDDQGMTPLCIALQCDSDIPALALMEHKANLWPDHLVSRIVSAHTRSTTTTVSASACSSSSATASHGSSSPSGVEQSLYHQLPLAIACMNGHYEVVKKILDMDGLEKCRSLRVPMDIILSNAMSRLHVRILRLLLAADPSLHSSSSSAIPSSAASSTGGLAIASRSTSLVVVPFSKLTLPPREEVKSCRTVETLPIPSCSSAETRPGDVPPSDAVISSSVVQAATMAAMEVWDRERDSIWFDRIRAAECVHLVFDAVDSEPFAKLLETKARAAKLPILSKVDMIDKSAPLPEPLTFVFPNSEEWD